MGFTYIGKPDKVGDFKIPKWWECGWRRTACNKKECILCGKILRDRQRHIDKGDDPDDMKSVMEDVGNSLGEALQMIKKHAESMGIDITNIDDTENPPEPKKFPLYRKVDCWRKSIENIVNAAYEANELWFDSVAAADLLWYRHTLAAKTYRQLCNKWHIDRGDEYGDVDYQYTKYVLSECLRILERSLAELSSLASEEKAELMLALGRLKDMKGEILKI